MENISIWIYGTGIGLLLALAIKTVPGLIARALSKEVDDLLDTPDEDDRALFLAVVSWVEKKIPGRGQGQKKFELAAAKLVKIFPKLKGNEIKLTQLIEQAVVAMKETLKSKVPA